MRSLAGLSLVCSALLLTGCASSHNSKIADSAVDLQAGLLDSALQRVDNHLTGSNANDFLLNLEKGELLRIDDRTQQSLQAFEIADASVVVWEDQVRNALAAAGGQVGATLFGDGMRDYEGQDYEKVMLTTRLALNRIAMADLDNARVDIRRTHEREALIEQARAGETAEAEKEAEENGVEYKQTNLSGYPVEIFDDPAVLSLKNGYQNAFSHYLAGYVYEFLNEPSLASAGYRQAIELRPGDAVLEKGLSELELRSTLFSTSKRAEKTPQTDVLFIVETGLAPARLSHKISLPIPTHNGLVMLSTAFPVVHPNPNALFVSQLSVGEQEVPVGLAADFNAMARRALQDELPGIMTRSTVRMVAKAVLQSEINRQAGALAGMFAALASSATEPDADDRMWRTLPERIYLARAAVPEGEHVLAIPGVTQTPSIMVRGERMLIPVRVVSTMAYFGRPIYVGEKVQEVEAEGGDAAAGDEVKEPTPVEGSSKVTLK